MKRTGIRILAGIGCICFSLLFCKMQSAEAAYVGRNNDSESVYRWTRIDDLEELKQATSDTKKDYRLLLMYQDTYDKSKAPKLDHYRIMTTAGWDGTKDCTEYKGNTNSFQEVPLSEASVIGYDSERFFTRGGLQTPYLNYTGTTFTCPSEWKLSGDAPVYRIYAANGDDDKKSDKLLLSMEHSGWDAHYRKWTESVYKGNNASEGAWHWLSDTWVITFPVIYDGYKQFRNTSASSSYVSATESYVGIYSGLSIKYPKDYYDRNDTRWMFWGATPGFVNYDEEPFNGIPGAGQSWAVTHTLLMKCYIGEEIQGENITPGTASIHENTTKTLDGYTRIQEGAVIKVKKGATLFISGTCFHNGIIQNEGGTVIIQAGALVQTIDPKQEYAGIIQCKDGGKLIVRRGARVIGNSISGNYDSILLENHSQLINKGCIMSPCTIGVFGGSAIRNDKGAYLELGYGVFNVNGKGGTLKEGYKGKRETDFLSSMEALEKDYRSTRRLSLFSLFYPNKVQIRKDEQSEIQNQGTCSIGGRAL